ncbi:MAG: glycosyltransferase family 39 protein [Chloroflexi bacterium]|nr:glycosyltransferase family 39 protein [Chloroflexota bacterium]
MTEPTVLDYVKSIFKDWASFTAFLRAWSERADTTQLVETSSAEEPSFSDLRPSTTFPWRSLLALLLALLAQRSFEPPAQNGMIGVPLYIAAFALIIWAFIRGEWTPAPLPALQTNADSLGVRSIELILALVFGAAAFWALSENRFTFWNVSLWLISVALFIRAFWLQEPQTLVQKIATSIARIRLTPWTALVFVVALLAIFFRFHRLGEVPLEMTSDHAEKLMDVFDITEGKYSIYFPRNTGREPLYIYLSAIVAGFAGISFLAIKIAAVIGGLLMLPYLYLLGKELGSKRIGLLAVAFAAIAYWPGVIERFALRISFYPLFVAPTLYYLIRGLRRQRRNDFILAGVALGLGLNGYMPFRIMPIAVVVIVGVYLLHVRDAQTRKQTLLWLGLLALTSFMFFIPLARYAMENPDMFGYRALTRVASIERPLPGTVLELFFGNLWNAAKEFNWDNGEIWVHSIPHRPALDIIAASLFLLGVFLVLARYLRSRHWTDLTLLLAIPLTQMPSILSLAFPDENPSLNRTAGAIVPVFLLVGVALDGLMSALGQEKRRKVVAWSLAGALFVLSFLQNYNLIFNTYRQQYAGAAWNTSEMGAVMKDAIARGTPVNNVWVVPFPYWVDTRLPPIWAGAPGRDIAVARENLPNTLDAIGPKLFMVARDDVETIALLQALYPLGELRLFESSIDPHDFWIFSVP